MSTNLKVKLYKGKTHADGSHPIQLQFYMDGKLKRKNIYSCQEKDWDPKESRVKSKVTNASYINNLISEKYAEHERELLKILNGQTPPKSFFSEKKYLTLDYILEQECIRFKNENKPGAYALLCCYRKEAAEFTESSTLNISEIDLEWFKKYAAYIYSEITVNGKVTKKANNGSSAQKKIKTIRRAVERYSGKLFSEEIKSYRQKLNKPVKQKLTSQELSRIENLYLQPGSLLDCVRDIFLLQVYLRGARVGSIIMAYSDQFADGRYAALNGTGKNNVGSRLIPKAQEIVNKYYGKHERLFPIYKFIPDPKATEFENSTVAHNHKKACTSLINKYLKEIAKKAEISKPLSSHIARHTFARLAIDKINNPMVTMELLGHSSLAVHQQYLNDIRKDDVLDAAADDIFS